MQEYGAGASVKDVVVRGSYTWTPYGFSVKKELMAKLNYEGVSDPTCKLKMGDVVELTPKIPDKSLTEYREEIQRMYESGVSVTGSRSRRTAVGWRR